MKQLNAGMLTPEEMAVARKALETALAKGAQQCRITLTKSLMDLYGTLDGCVCLIHGILGGCLSGILCLHGCVLGIGGNTLCRLDCCLHDGLYGCLGNGSLLDDTGAESFELLLGDDLVCKSLCIGLNIGFYHLGGLGLVIALYGLYEILDIRLGIGNLYGLGAA